MEKYAVYQASDIHIRCSKSYGNNKADVLHFTEQLMKYIREQGHLNSSTVILLLGDIFDKSTNHLTHTGTIVSTFKQMLYLMQPCTVLIIPGNHDIPRDNSADDIIAACLKHVEYKHVLYCKSHGLVYTLDDSIRFYHHPVVIPGVDDRTVDLDEQYFNIGLFHEQVLEKSTTVSDSNTVRSIVQLHENYDLYLVGDAHNKWSMLDDRLVYSGAPIQHRMGECIDKYFVHWTIEKSEDDWLYSRKYIPLTLKSLFIHLPNINTGDIDSILDSIDELIDRHADEEYSIKAIKLEFSADTDVDDIAVRNAIIEEYRVKPTINIVTEEDIIAVQSNEQYVEDIWQIVLNSIADDERLLQYHSEVQSRLESSTNSRSKGKRWQLLDMKWSNVGCYGADNYVDFRRMKGMIHLRGKNSSGKSTFVDILLMALYGTAGGSMSTDTILNNIYSRGNYSIQLRIYTPDDDCTYTLERYGTRTTMKHRLTILYSDGSSKTVEGARNMETHLSTILPSADGSSSYSLLTSTCVALQDRVLNISDIRFNVVDDLDRVIDELTRELNSNSNRLQMPEIPKYSKPDRVASDKDCAAEILKYETELDRLRGKLFDSAQFNESTVSKYSKYSTVDIETVQSQISDLRSSLYSDSEVQYSTDTDMLRDAIATQSRMLLRCPTGPIDCTVEQVTAQLEALNLGTTLTDKSESELQSIIDEYNKTVQTDGEEQRHDEEIPLGLRSKPYSTVQPVLPSTLVLEQLPVKNSRYSSTKIEKIDGELSRISSKLSIVSKLLEQYTQYCVQYNIPIPPGKADSIERPPLKKDLVRVEYCKKPATVPDSRLKLESIAKSEAMSSVSIEKELNEYTEYCNMHSIVVPHPVDYSEGATVTEQRSEERSDEQRSEERSDEQRKRRDEQRHPSHCSVTVAPSLKEDLVRVEYVSKPSTDREYSAEELNDMRETRARLYDELVEYEQYCTVHSIPIPTAKVSRVDRPVLKENLQRVEYRSKPKVSLAALSSHIQSLSKLSLFSHTHSLSTADDEEVLLQHIEQLETTIAKSCRVDPALLCTDCRARVQCMTDTEYEQYVDALDKCRLMLEYSRYLKYEEYSKYISTVGNYTAYLRQRLQTIDYSIKEAEQYMNWLNYSRYEQYVQSVGKYTAYLRVQYDTVQQYEQYIKYEEYSKYVSTVGKYTAYLRTIVGKYEECIEELQARKNNYIYEQCHDYYWYLNRRRILRSEIDRYRHDLSVIRDRRKKKQLETKLRVLKGQHNCTVRRKIKELESLVDGRLCYDRCLHNSTVLKEIETVEDILHCLDQWQLYYMKIKQYDEWRQSYDIKRRYLTVLEEVRDSRLEYCRSTVEAVCNEMLHNIYGSSKRIVISRDTESKRSSNRYRIVLEDNGRIVRRMAHSIKFILDILVRCALIRFNSNLPNFMIIDEGFGALDIENAVQFWSELKAEMSRYLDYSIVIDHGVAHDDEQVDVMCISTSVTGSTLKY